MLNFKSKIGVALLLAASASMAQAAMYNVQGSFDEPGAAGGDTVFNGTFDWNGTALTGLMGTMNSSMYNIPANPNLTLNQNATWSLIDGVVKASVFLLNSSNVFSDVGYDAATPAKGKTSGTENAYFTFAFDTAGGTVAPTGLTISMQYGDCTGITGESGGIMGSTCMTGYGPQTGFNSMGKPKGAGTMGAYAQSLTITPQAVPLPAAAWLFGSALVSLFGVNRRKQVLPA